LSSDIDCLCGREFMVQKWTREKTGVVREKYEKASGRALGERRVVKRGSR